MLSTWLGTYRDVKETDENVHYIICFCFAYATDTKLSLLHRPKVKNGMLCVKEGRPAPVGVVLPLDMQNTVDKLV